MWLCGDCTYDPGMQVLGLGGLLCPQPGCGAGILLEGGEGEAGHCSRVGCPECGYVFCRDCGAGAHLGPCLPCPDLPSATTTANSSWVAADPSTVTIRTTSKPCPGCRVATERSGGCMHMVSNHSGILCRLKICKWDLL